MNFLSDMFFKQSLFGFSKKAISRILTIAIILIIIISAIVTVWYFQGSLFNPPTPTPPISPTPTASPTAIPTSSPPQSEWKPDGIIEKNEYTHAALFASGSLEIHWKNDNDFLYMALNGQTKGWLSIGFEPSFSMKDADMIFGWVTDDEEIVLDLFSTGAFGPHPPDTELGGSDNILEYGGIEDETNTVIEFNRRLITQDIYDKELQQGQTVDIIWAMGSNDNLDFAHNIAKGTGQIILD